MRNMETSYKIESSERANNCNFIHLLNTFRSSIASKFISKSSTNLLSLVSP